jgi:DNA replication and repair protein RecF
LHLGLFESPDFFVALLHLHIQSFRNLRDIRWDVAPGLNVLEGENAQGKTNLLETIFFLANGRSFRNLSWEELIPWGETGAQWEGRVVSRELASEIRVKLGGAGKELELNGKALGTWRTIGPVFRVLVFTPESTALLRAAPVSRRRYFDHALSLLHPLYGSWLNRYQRLVQQRNQLLQMGLGGGAAEALAAFDQQWAEQTQQISAARRTYLAELLPLWLGRIQQLSTTLPKLTARWEGPLGEEDLQTTETLLTALQSQRREELHAGHTLMGPHREDLQVFLGGHPARAVASQGQHRILTIALKMAEADRYRQTVGQSPVFLLDDLGSELDPQHLRHLLHLLDELNAQTILTTAQTGSLAPLKAPTYLVRAGEISKKT